MRESDPRESEGRLPTVDRRGFVRSLLGFSIISTIMGVLTPIIGYLWPPARSARGGGGRVLVGTLTDIPPGQAEVLPINDKPVIVVNTQDNQVRAFSAICTHLGCVCEWEDRRQFILCPCHDGRFNALTGAVISGPPPSPLPSVEVVVEDGDIYAGGA
ncbi:MAG: Cytochrome b6-f complex iron-sulfur subunit [Anaerolineales bacterium]|nr:Cytochrome b6-f complex iron-sulfur subunit [Anaerolineales bacterium]